MIRGCPSVRLVHGTETDHDQSYSSMPGGSRRSVPRLLLELEDAEGVLARVDDPGGPGQADGGDAVLGLEPGPVVVLDLTPRVRSSATSARTLVTCQEAWVWE